ncbi:unnamed protein product [Bursaphelenchus xylophilus]|uniref:(pine wood nematode) hypothetical protein n=1 Tax=Bursaphelenchus xylophilus TaxID=6326 RepID=A0A1I7S9D6_BURXY|nr:unnamed protein product [Bursaphelenchus xylophilus]CAG9100545.1 unnamed protein product [Bursaphelenchus xylophilus]
MLRTAFFLLFFSTLASGYITNYYVTVRLNDQPNVDRHFIIDTTASQSFVIPFANFLNHPENYASWGSKTYKRLPGEIAEDYQYSKATVKGGLAEDEIHLDNKTFRGQFSISSTLLNANPAINFHKRWSIGSIGLSRKKVEGSLKDAILEQFEEKNVCLSTAPGEKTSGVTSYTTIGAKSFPKSAFLTKIIAEDNQQGHWQFPLKFVKLGCFNAIKPDESAILSTATDDIIVPYDYFSFITDVLGAKFDDKHQGYLVNCTKTLPFLVGINDEILSIPFGSYTEKKTDGTCLLKIRWKRDVDYFVLGAPLLVETGVCLDFKTSVLTFFNTNEKATEIEEKKLPKKC